MSAVKMHAGEPDVDVALVRRLVAAQFPQYADRPVQHESSAGTDNALFRLGADLVVRLPRIGWAVDDVAKEQRWLPVLAPHLPLDVPVPVGCGRPAEGYPWPWSVYRWLDGTTVAASGLADLPGAARQLAAFVRALQAIDATDGPPPGPMNRGAHLAVRDAVTRESAAQITDLVDVPAVLDVWDDAIAAPQWVGLPVWVHGDLTAGNLLARDGRLAAVIDFGALRCGDPAADLLVAWNLFPPDARDVYRSAVGADDAMWARGRGWAVSVSVLELAYYRTTNPPLVARARHVIEQVLAAR